MSTTCKRCGRPLKTERSIERGYGPTCKRKHDKAEADAEFLKRQVTLEDVLEYEPDKAVGR